MEFIGLLRTMQPVLMTALVLLIVMSLFYLVSRKIASRVDDESVAINVRCWSNVIYGLVVIFVVAGVLLQGLQVAATNRMPRSDVTPKSGVFEQMEKNQQQGQ